MSKTITTACMLSLLLHLIVVMVFWHTTPSPTNSPSFNSVHLTVRSSQPAVPIIAPPEPVDQSHEQELPNSPATVEPVSSAEEQPLLNSSQKTVQKSLFEKDNNNQKAPPKTQGRKAIKQVEEPTITKKNQPPLNKDETSNAPTEKVKKPQPANSQNTTALDEWKDRLLARINQNKLYPYMAKRKRLEGRVKIRAIINSDGSLKDAEVISGNRLFHKSTIRAIRQSLPLPTPENTQVQVFLTIRYQLL